MVGVELGGGGPGNLVGGWKPVGKGPRPYGSGPFPGPWGGTLGGPCEGMEPP